MTPESKLKLEVTSFLKASGEFYLRLNSGKVKVRGGYMQLCPTGTPDFVVFRKGSVNWIELKVDWKSTEPQMMFVDTADAYGHRHAICKTLDQVREFLK